MRLHDESLIDVKKIVKINCDYKKNSEFLIKGLKRNNTRLIVAGESHILMTKGWQSFDKLRRTSAVRQAHGSGGDTCCCWCPANSRHSPHPRPLS